MGKILENLNMVLVIGLVLAIGLMMGFHAEAITEMPKAFRQWRFAPAPYVCEWRFASY